MLATSFHPELTGNAAFHQYFIGMCSGKKKACSLSENIRFGREQDFYFCCTNSSMVSVAVPTFFTTIPAAILAVLIASLISKPAARQSPSVATTVSPAPLTSKTSSEWVGI